MAISIIGVTTGVIGVVFLIILMMVLKHMKSSKVQEKSGVLPLGFLSFEYEKLGEYGNLYYETFEGEKLLIATHLLGKDMEKFILDEERRLIFYIDAQRKSYMVEIGKKPKKLEIVGDGLFFEQDKSGRFIFGPADKMDHFLIIDKEERKIHNINTGYRAGNTAFGNFFFEEDTKSFYFLNINKEIWCSREYKPAQKLEQQDRFYIDSEGLLRRRENKKEGIWFELVAKENPKKEQLKALWMHQGQEKWLIASHVRGFAYHEEAQELYFLDGCQKVWYVDVNTLNPDAGIEKKQVAKEISKITTGDKGKLVIGIEQHRKSYQRIYYISKEGARLLSETTEESDLIFDKLLFLYDDYVIFIERQKEAETLKCFTPEREVQTLLEHVEDYDMIKLDKHIILGQLKYGQVVGNYYIEKWDTLVKFTEDQQIIAYNNGREVGSIYFDALQKLGHFDQRIELVPRRSNVFEINIFKDMFWNHQLVLGSPAALVRNDITDNSYIYTEQETITLIPQTEEEFDEKMQEELDDIEEQKKEQLVTPDEAVLFTKWYIGYKGESMPFKIVVDREEKDFYVVQTDAFRQYRVNKQSGEVSGEATNLLDKIASSAKEEMSYKIEDDTLYMVDSAGNKGRLINLSALCYGDDEMDENERELLWHYKESVYFTTRCRNKEDDYREDLLYRYDLIQRKVVCLHLSTAYWEDQCAYSLEKERDTILVKTTLFKDYFCDRIDRLTGEVRADVQQEQIAREGAISYEIIGPEDQTDYFITAYHNDTKEEQLLCKADRSYYELEKVVYPAIKIGDEIYFMDYSHYLSDEEKDRDVWPYPVAYCKVNVKSCEVTRMNEQERTFYCHQVGVQA